MRTTSDSDAVRLYHLDADSGAATTLLYGTMAEALRAAEAEPEDVQQGLFLQTSNDVAAYLDLIGE
ncbi:hypothetical protein HL653_13615 [Sphingomonas sp. AP4-R1]|uniref:hypothetical protein n=1 Tax=Sphingomonas sp. AP4-R1 TaxID=2735134 RepID=UPI001493D5E0|nr:hypothetical protein [Sphingomonas sp. AP4-R1]QJU58664.1 hypothetical protein HL653_13615 [Sphingomonas sp. AP4-R1]